MFYVFFNRICPIEMYTHLKQPQLEVGETYF